MIKSSYRLLLFFLLLLPLASLAQDEITLMKEVIADRYDRVEQDGFYMDVHDVTVGQFRDLSIRVAITMAVIGIL